ncbi:hypothetical protein [Paracidovorax citrulli]|uniref:Uncharacterized protein n=1 Tax=Paracidovorax citrulli TaxID=80869 RepID=A0ABY9AWX3_PARCI|nr:hypothetical protein [Paracidovorax citrulli]UEG48478.1 hypothetical protein LKW27_17610 [Paracidovorax citrulli]WIY32580.1 hypothetical protein QRO09_15390 [Paracidovorax citrulli]WIY41819.1 hypothetical protein QRO10_15655 [Paracidovorax citrulli]WIY46625.1 hypothetical protein QRO12_05400 [Paracidovorax citrulli]WIY51439.1 hypothetical protein QRO08_19500 [Paracidovorax citrulli]
MNKPLSSCHPRHIGGSSPAFGHGGLQDPAGPLIPNADAVQITCALRQALRPAAFVADLWINGQIGWYPDPPMDKIRVGRDVVFVNIPPECTGCPTPPGFRRHALSASHLRSRLAPLQ